MMNYKHYGVYQKKMSPGDHFVPKLPLKGVKLHRPILDKLLFLLKLA